MPALGNSTSSMVQVQVDHQPHRLVEDRPKIGPRPPRIRNSKSEFETMRVKWTKIEDAPDDDSIQMKPKPRHGHRAVAYEHLMIVFGGGSEGIVDDLSVYDTMTRQWHQPAVKGDVPAGRAAFGAAVDGSRMLIFGGMKEHGQYSADLYELNLTTWEWRKLKPKAPRLAQVPCPRLGHSFTLIRDEIYIFGGLTNDGLLEQNINIPRYLDDLYSLKIKLNNQNGIWEKPITFGSPPTPRESHSAVAYASKDRSRKLNKLIIYGGMHGCRLGDCYLLDFDTRMWSKADLGGTIPNPRSLHSATLVGNKMWVFGGWIPLPLEEVICQNQILWKCDNFVGCLDVENCRWDSVYQDNSEENLPCSRAGHSAVAINTCIYMWGGRNGFKRNQTGEQVCCGDLWKLEVRKPGSPGKVQLVRSATNVIELKWNPVPGADSYILQCLELNVLKM